MVKEIVIRKVLEAVVDKLPHQPANDEESRELFKKIVKSMKKGDVRKEILQGLDKYFTLFEEVLIQKDELLKKVISGDSHDSQKMQVILKKLNSSFHTNTSNSTDLTKHMENLLLGSISMDEFIAGIIRLRLPFDLSARNEIATSTFASIVIRCSVPQPSLPSDSYAAVFSYFYVLLSNKRHEIITSFLSLLGQREDGRRVVGLLSITFLGYVAFWVLHTNAGVGSVSNKMSQVLWNMDNNKNGMDTPSSSTLIGTDDLDIELLMTMITTRVIPNCSTVSSMATGHKADGLKLLQANEPLTTASLNIVPIVSLGLFNTMLLKYPGKGECKVLTTSCSQLVEKLIENEWTVVSFGKKAVDGDITTAAEYIWGMLYDELSTLTSSIVDELPSSVTDTTCHALFDWMKNDEITLKTMVSIFATKAVSVEGDDEEEEREEEEEEEDVDEDDVEAVEWIEESNNDNDVDNTINDDDEEEEEEEEVIKKKHNKKKHRSSSVGDVSDGEGDTSDSISSSITPTSNHKRKRKQTSDDMEAEDDTKIVGKSPKARRSKRNN